jgi:hypothetical protein
MLLATNIIYDGKIARNKNAKKIKKDKKYQICYFYLTGDRL